jgi:hypothetical protein
MPDHSAPSSGEVRNARSSLWLHSVILAWCLSSGAALVLPRNCFNNFVIRAVVTTSEGMKGTQNLDT